ncbi:MAG: serpin family protein [Oscillospiraceae bacterium]|nr:serpin family protein [Oscillospiraceae bacterium]
MKKVLAAISAFILTLSLSACGETPAQTLQPGSQISNPTSQTSQPSTSTGGGTTEKKTFAPIKITGDNILNSVRVFDTMYEDNKQAMFSPLSLNMCLGMLEAGAAGSSKTALDAYLGNTDYAAFVANYLEHTKGFNREVDNAYSKYKDVFEIANSFWASKQRPFSEDYKKHIAESFGAEIENVDFSASEKAAAKINGWVNEKTHEMIPSVVSADQLGDDTAAVLVNTVYFESAWSDDWYVPAEKETFTNADGSTNDIELMRNGGDSYFENDSAAAFSCYYKNGMQFVGILPKKEGDFTLESLDIGSLLKTESRDYDVSARMPKLNFESSFPLTEALQAAGLSDLFDPDKADLTSMQGSSEQQFYVSEVIQKTKLELDEEGTRAAAATAIITNDAAAMPVEREIKEVFLNRPFAFLIYDGEAGQIVFMGKVTEM